MRQLKITKSITNRENVSLDKYLSEIGRHELISAEEEVILAARIKLGDQVAIDKMTNSNLRFVVSVAKQYQNRGMTLGDLINEGNLGLIKAVRRFDATRGFKFISYAVWWIRQSIMQAVNEQSRMVRLPLNKVGDLNQIRKAQGNLEQILEREPTNEELSLALEMSEKEIENAMKVAARHVSTDATMGESDSMTMIDILVNHDAMQPDEDLIRESLKMEIDRALSKLNDKEREIIILFYGIGEKHAHTLEEIGEKFDLTRERVRQIKEKALKKLKTASKSKLLRTYLG
jgi:RNA polymerase primary sigma factor